jgi:hypothetical protein
MHAKQLTEDEQLRRFKERVARILRDYEKKIQEARDRYDKKSDIDADEP